MAIVDRTKVRDGKEDVSNEFFDAYLYWSGGCFNLFQISNDVFDCISQLVVHFMFCDLFI